jgi:hypothetical protein
MVWANVVNAVVGLWFILAPFVLRFSDRTTPMWLSILGGAILLILAGWAALSESARRQTWIQYVNGLVGIWFIAFPYVYRLGEVAHVPWTSVVGGLIALVLSAWLAFSVLPKEARAKS